MATGLIRCPTMMSMGTDDDRPRHPSEDDLEALARADAMERQLELLKRATGPSSRGPDPLVDRRGDYVNELIDRLDEARARADGAARELDELRGERGGSR